MADDDEELEKAEPSRWHTGTPGHFPTYSAHKLRQLAASGLGELHVLEREVTRWQRTQSEDGAYDGAVKTPPHVVTLQDVTRGLGLDPVDAARVERLVNDTLPTFTQKTQTQRIMHARSALLSLLRDSMKQIPSDARDELLRRAVAYWKRHHQTDYGKVPTVRFHRGEAKKSMSDDPIPVLTVDRLLGPAQPGPALIVPLEKAARGGKYYRRVPYTDAKGKRRYRYYYTKQSYERAHGEDGHKHGPEVLASRKGKGKRRKKAPEGQLSLFGDNAEAGEPQTGPVEDPKAPPSEPASATPRPSPDEDAPTDKPGLPLASAKVTAEQLDAEVKQLAAELGLKSEVWAGDGWPAHRIYGRAIDITVKSTGKAFKDGKALLAKLRERWSVIGPLNYREVRGGTNQGRNAGWSEGTALTLRVRPDVKPGTSLENLELREDAGRAPPTGNATLGRAFIDGLRKLFVEASDRTVLMGTAPEERTGLASLVNASQEKQDAYHANQLRRRRASRQIAQLVETGDLVAIAAARSKLFQLHKEAKDEHKAAMERISKRAGRKVYHLASVPDDDPDKAVAGRWAGLEADIRTNWLKPLRQALEGEPPKIEPQEKPRPRPSGPSGEPVVVSPEHQKLIDRIKNLARLFGSEEEVLKQNPALAEELAAFEQKAAAGKHDEPKVEEYVYRRPRGDEQSSAQVQSLVEHIRRELGKVEPSPPGFDRMRDSLYRKLIGDARLLEGDVTGPARERLKRLIGDLTRMQTWGQHSGPGSDLVGLHPEADKKGEAAAKREEELKKPKPEPTPVIPVKTARERFAAMQGESQTIDGTSVYVRRPMRGQNWARVDVTIGKHGFNGIIVDAGGGRWQVHESEGMAAYGTEKPGAQLAITDSPEKALKNIVARAKELMAGPAPAPQPRPTPKPGTSTTSGPSGPSGKSKPKPASPSAPAETPRGEAERQATSSHDDEDSDYANSRKSKVGHRGEDVKGSARHKAMEWKSLRGALEHADAGKMFTRKFLEKNEPLDFITPVQQGADASEMLFFALALRKFQAAPDKKVMSKDHYYVYRGDKLIGGYRGTKEGALKGEEHFKKQREDYYNAWQRAREIVERHAAAAAEGKPPPVDATNANVRSYYGIRVSPEEQKIRERRNALLAELRPLVMELRQTTGRGSGQEAIRKMYNGIGGEGSTSPVAQVMALKKKIAEPEAQREAAMQMIEGKSLNKVTGTKVERGKRFDIVSQYDTDVMERTGPPSEFHGVTQGLDMLDGTAGGKFGMRGVQWGKSVTDGERAHHLKSCVDSFNDLTSILGLPPQMASYNGKLAIAIGARGRGNALAHYEPGQKVINLTRAGGAGSLAHEWGHFFDFMVKEVSGSVRVGGMQGSGGAFTNSHNADMTPQPDTSYSPRKAPASSTEHAMQAFRESDAYHSFSRRIRKVTEKLGMKGGQASYWQSHDEQWARCFERHVQRKLEKSGRKNTYLVAVKKEAGGASGLWPTDEEVDAMAPHFDAIFKAFRESDLLHKALAWLGYVREDYLHLMKGQPRFVVPRGR